jgi:hypothetical protein
MIPSFSVVDLARDPNIKEFWRIPLLIFASGILANPTTLAVFPEIR